MISWVILALKFWPFFQGKTAQKEQFFKIGLFLIQKWKTHETNAYSAILGGYVGMKKSSPFLDLGAQNPIFGHLNTGTFPIFRCPKIGF